MTVCPGYKCISTEISTPVAITPRLGTSTCRTCGVNKNNGKRSCCLRGGTWFKNCGDPGDPKFVHTWSEGIEACKGIQYANLVLNVAVHRACGIHNVWLSTDTGNPSVTNPSSTCSKCGPTNSGKLSCCSRGGTWFRNCGDAGDPKFDHTWSEGMEACKSKLGAN